MSKKLTPEELAEYNRRCRGYDAPAQVALLDHIAAQDSEIARLRGLLESANRFIKPLYHPRLPNDDIIAKLYRAIRAELEGQNG